MRGVKGLFEVKPTDEALVKDADPRSLKKLLRASSVIIDAPKLTELDSWMSFDAFLSQELAFARNRPAFSMDKKTLLEFLESTGALDQLERGVEEVDLGIRLASQFLIATGNPSLRILLLVSPDRLDAPFSTWLDPVRDYCRQEGRTSALLCAEETYRRISEGSEHAARLKDIEMTHSRIGSTQ
jgi:hypothetical protein